MPESAKLIEFELSKELKPLMGEIERHKMENFGWTVLSSVLSATAIFLVQRSYRNSDSRELEKIKSDIQKDREIFLNKLLLNSELRFKLYNELWANLTELETIVEHLWNKNLTPTGVKDLAKVVRLTDKKVKESALIIEDNDFARLGKILNTLKNYHVGKQKLLSLEDVDEHASNEIQRQIDENFDLRSEYVDLKKEMFTKMKERVGL